MTATGGGKKLKQLEHDFNSGDPIDLAPYQNVLAMVGSMGFNTEDALEAALVTGTQENIQLITDYIFLGPADKKKRYDKKKAEMVSEVKLTPSQEKAIEELKKLHREIQQENQKTNQLQQELKERNAVTKLEKCTEYVRGILADEAITEEEGEALKKYLKKEDIDDKTYEAALEKLDYNSNDLEELKKAQDDSGGKNCVLCRMNPKEFCVFPCMHVVICQKCAKDLKSASGPGAGDCPACSKPFSDIQKVFID